MTIKMLTVVAGACLLIGCGGSPTGPSPSPTPPVPAPSTPEPTPAPPVTPEPPPVVPVPVPVPTPAPKRWIAATETEHWYGPALLSGHFEVAWGSTLTADRYNTWPVLFMGESSILAGDRNATFSIVFTSPTSGTWTFNGLAGQAAGTLTYE